MEIYNIFWTLLESVTYIFIIVIFFNDPIRRWNFFGYRPTAVMGLFDPHLGKIIFSRVNHAWSFNQGGMYESDIYATVKSILKRELGLSETRFKLVYTKPLGAIRIHNKQLLTRSRISTISIFKDLRGKGYMGCFIRTNLSEIEPEIRKGAGIQEVRIVTYAEARELVKSCTTNEHQPKKQAFILSMIDEMEAFAHEIKTWEQNFPMEENPSPKKEEPKADSSPKEA